LRRWLAKGVVLTTLAGGSIHPDGDTARISTAAG